MASREEDGNVRMLVGWNWRNGRTPSKTARSRNCQPQYCPPGELGTPVGTDELCEQHHVSRFREHGSMASASSSKHMLSLVAWTPTISTGIFLKIIYLPAGLEFSISLVSGSLHLFRSAVPNSICSVLNIPELCPLLIVSWCFFFILFPKSTLLTSSLVPLGSFQIFCLFRC